MIDVKIVNWANCGDVIERVLNTSATYQIFQMEEEEMFVLIKKFLAEKKGDRPINVMIKHDDSDNKKWTLYIDDRRFGQR